MSPREDGEEVHSKHVDNDRETLSRRLSLLIDAWEFQNSEDLTFPLISAHLASHGVTISRQRWWYMTKGNGHLVSEEPLLRAVASFFEVEEQYLLDLDSEPPASVAAQLNFVQDLREQRVERFAARNLSGVAPETLSLISEAIRKSRERRKGEANAD